MLAEDDRKAILGKKNKNAKIKMQKTTRLGVPIKVQMYFQYHLASSCLFLVHFVHGVRFFSILLFKTGWALPRRVGSQLQVFLRIFKGKTKLHNMGWITAEKKPGKTGKQ